VLRAGSQRTFQGADAALIKKECTTIADAINDLGESSVAIPLECGEKAFGNLLSHLAYLAKTKSGTEASLEFLDKSPVFANLKDDQDFIKLTCVAELCGIATEKVPFGLIDKKSLDKLTDQERAVYKQALARNICARFPLYKMPQAIIEEFKGFHPDSIFFSILSMNGFRPMKKGSSTFLSDAFLKTLP